jgi:Zn-dependent metalloprotease
MLHLKRIAFTLSSLTLALGACTADDPIVVDDDAEAPVAADLQAERAAAHAYLAAAVPDLAAADLEVTRAGVDELGMTHVRHQQRVGGIPVIGGEAIFHIDSDGALHGITDHLMRGVAVDTTPTLTADDAIERAIDATGGWAGVSAPPTADLAIRRDDTGDHLVWRVAIERLATDDVADWSKPLVLVDAHAGAVLHQGDRIVDADVAGTGVGRYVGNVQIRTWSDPGGLFWLEDDARRLTVATLGGGEQDDSVSRLADSDNVWTGDTSAVAVQWALNKTWDYYNTTFSRRGIDGANGPGYVTGKSGHQHQSALVHWGSSINNARWVDPQMVFGDGDGTRFSPLVSLDIVAHEFTHGVTSRESALGDDGESPALNEHLSDAFAASIESSLFGVDSRTWKIGEQAFTPGTTGDALRYMNDPAADGTAVDTWNSSLAGADEHDGAGVGNLAFYLVSQGGSHPRHDSAHVTGVGIGNAQRVWYRAMTTALTSASDYDDLRTATLEAAADLYGAGGSTYRAVHSAWEAVGLPHVTCPGFEVTTTGGLVAGGAANSSTFLSNDGSVVGFLGHDQADNFDLELWTYDWALSAWKRVRTATGPGNNEIISHSPGAAAWYYWRVVATGGSGGYAVCWNS